MAKIVEKHELTSGDEWYWRIQKQSNSSVWYVRFKVSDKPYAEPRVISTKQRDLNKAIIAAVEIRSKHLSLAKYGITPRTGSASKEIQFGTIAKRLISSWSKSWNPKDKNFKAAGILKHWHIPYFDKTPIEEIDELAYKNFREWQDQKASVPLTAGTIRIQNVALRKVFNQAVLLKYIQRGQVPRLEVNASKVDGRREFLTKEQYTKVFSEAKQLLSTGKPRTQFVREILPLYMEFVVRTGLRPGTETQNIEWQHIYSKTIEGEDYLLCKIVKGKTTKYTGSREIVIDDALKPIIAKLKELHGGLYKPDGLVFMGIKQDKFTKIFNTILKKLDLYKDSEGNKRSLYSLRHSYITWQLEKGMEKGKIAKQCGTSEAMIEQHYSHVTPSMYARELAGRNKDYIEAPSVIDSPIIQCAEDGTLFI